MIEMSMRERVARALCEAVNLSLGAKTVEHEWRAWRKEADAVIAAMREPTDAMVEGGDEPLWDGEHCHGVWRAMIDAAISEVAS